MNKDSGNAIIQCKPTQSSRPAIIATDWNKNGSNTSVVTVTPSLTFTNGNWNTPQTVTGFKGGKGIQI
jgi:hypothetical protein